MARPRGLTKICPGYYERTLAITERLQATVTIDQLDEGPDSGWWIVRAQWDRYTYSDPVRTLREAAEIAEYLVNERIAELKGR